MGKWGTGKLLKICKECKKEFSARKDRLGFFCSRSCSRKNKPQKSYKLNKICKVCKINFTVRRYRKYSALYCSVKCRRKNMPSKENHKNWKGGIARTWKSKIIIKKLIKEKEKCEECFSTYKLQGHHIIPYSEDKTLQEDLNNIMVLCINCHAKKHPRMANFILKGTFHE